MGNVTKIIYIGSYCNAKNINDERLIFPAALTKCEYITKKIKECDFNIEIVSSPITLKRRGYFETVKGINENGIGYTIGPTFGVNTRIGKIVQKLFSRIWLFFYLIINTNKKTKVVLYHSPSVIDPVKLTHRLKKYELILEVEELYSAFPEISRNFKRKEINFINGADKYIFVSETLQKRLNSVNKPFIISYGAYSSHTIKEKVKDGKIHLIYAGTFDTRKRGAINAIECCKYLNKKYVLHVLGFGSDSEIKLIKESIDASNIKNDCKIVYEGCLLGEEYKNMLSRCSIGISTQTTEGEYNLTSFPSKILIYLSYGLEVVTTRIKVLEDSKINSVLHYVNSNDPQGIADSILSIKTYGCENGISLIKQLDCEFKQHLSQLLVGE